MIQQKDHIVNHQDNLFQMDGEHIKENVMRMLIIK